VPAREAAAGPPHMLMPRSRRRRDLYSEVVSAARALALAKRKTPGTGMVELKIAVFRARIQKSQKFLNGTMLWRRRRRRTHTGGGTPTFRA
jgi:hypothetical protein